MSFGFFKFWIPFDAYIAVVGIVKDGNQGESIETCLIKLLSPKSSIFYVFVVTN